MSDSPAADTPAEKEGMKRILIVDDEATFTRMVRMNLEQTGRFEVREENKAANAIATAKEFNPDLILLDVIMPAMDGGELASLMKTDPEPELSQIPIVFLTATVSKNEDQNDGFTSGGFIFLAKPVSLESLLKVIDDSLAKG